jgi:SulP family sulfate permease
MSALDHIAEGTRVVILDFEHVPAMDATGLVNLESVLARLHRDRALVILAGVQPQPLKVLHKAGIDEEQGRVAFSETTVTAVELARAVRAEAPPSVTTPLAV